MHIRAFHRDWELFSCFRHEELLMKSRILLLAIVLPSFFISCNDLYLIGYSMNIPIVNVAGWENFKVAIAPGSEGVYDSKSIKTPGSVIKDGSLYKMWYSGKSDGGEISIIYCDSTDAEHWSDFTQVIGYSTGTIADMPKYFPVVIKEWHTYTMWFTGYEDGLFNLYSATSNDGINWGQFRLAIAGNQMGTVDEGGIWSCSVINDSGTYKIWYGVMEGDYVTGRIYYRESGDSITWGDPRLVVDIGTFGNYNLISSDNPAVIKDGEVYRMWYTGYSDSSTTMLYCESFNGKNWSDSQVVFGEGAEGVSDVIRISNPFVMNDNGLGRMWYSGNDSDSVRRIIYCETR